MQFLALDVGEKRIGVARADGETKFPVPHSTITVDGAEISTIEALVNVLAVDTVVIGYPRNQNGEPTAQTAIATAFAEKLRHLPATIVFQDESLTSVLAEEHLKANNKQYTRADIDAHAAAIVLGDYLEELYAKKR